MKLRFFRPLAVAACLGLTPLVLAGPFSDWSRMKFGTPSAAPCGDEDGDGLTTLWEYYCNRDPLRPDGPFPASVSAQRTGGVVALSAELPLPTAASDATVEWQVSSDLLNWITVAASVNGAPFTGAGAAGVANGRALFRDPTPGAGPHRFARWRIAAASAGPGAPGAAPIVSLSRDDRVATLDLDYDAERPWGLWWEVNGDGRSDAGFRVTWWPTTGPSAGVVKSLVTANRRVQLQPLVNDAAYRVRVERLNALGELTSAPTELAFNGGDGTRVAALRAAMTYFDDFNLPEGAPDPLLWNNAHSTATDPRFAMFFINAQYHAHTLVGTQTNGPHPGDKAQSAQRFRKPMALEAGVRRRIVFDMDSPIGPRATWYLDFNPVQTDLTGHTDFFDSDGSTGLPAGMLRLRAGGGGLSVFLAGRDGTFHQIAVAYLDDVGRQVIPNVRRAWDVRLGTDAIQIFIDGRSVIDTSFAATPLDPGNYELLWSSIGYNTAKENSPYFLVHWDNFGFDGPVVEPRTVHDYVTQIEGDDYQKANRDAGQVPTFTVTIPDESHPTVAGATTEAWLVFTYQMGDYNTFTLVPGDHVLVNGRSYPLPPKANNSVPLVPELVLAWDRPYTVRIKLGDIVRGGPSPLVVGDNTFQFFAETTGILNVHVELFFPAGSAPAYTPPSALHHFPMHGELPQFGPPARFQQIGNANLGNTYNPFFDEPATVFATLSGRAPVTVLIGNESGVNQPDSYLVSPARSAELWATGGVAGIRKVEVFLRPFGGDASTARRVAVLTTERDAPAPQVRHTFEIDTTPFANGDYELFVLATAANGVLSHPAYIHSAFHFDSSELAGAYFPVHVRIAN